MTVKNDSCLFCTPDELCVTHAAKVKKPKAKSQKPKATPVAPKPDDGAAEWFGKEKESRFSKRAEAESVQTEDDLMLREAIRNLYPLLQYKSRYKDLIDPPKSAAFSRTKAEVRRSLDGSME